MLNKVIILLLLFTFTHQQDNEVHAKFEKLKETPFGSTVAETIALQLNGPEPLQNLITMLQDLNTKLEGEQERDDRLHERFQSQCENVQIMPHQDLGQLEETINENTSISKLLKSQLDQLSPDKQAKESDLVRKQTEFEELKNELQYQQEQRETEKSRYEQTLDNLEQALYALNEAKKLFNDFLNVLIKNKQRFASSFIEKQKFLESEQVLTLTEISQQINKMKHNVKAEGFNFLLHGIAHLTNLLQNDPAEQQEQMSMKVLEVMNQVENWIQKQRISEDISEQQRADAFTQLQLMLEDHIIFSQQMITGLQGSIDSLNSQIQGAANEKAEADLKISVKQTQMDDRESDCRNEELDYNKETDKRNKERNDLDIALDLVINSIGQLKKEVIQK